MAKGTKGLPMTGVPPAPPKRQEDAIKKENKKGSPEGLIASSTTAKRSPDDLVPLNFRVAAEFKKDMKLEAAENEITQLELLYRMRAFWKEHHR